MKNLKNTLLIVPVIILLAVACKPSLKKTGDTSGSPSPDGRQIFLLPENPVHSIAYYEEGKFAAWPANNGVWIWDGTEILVGFTVGPYEEKSGHNLGEPYVSLLSRSLDGGITWEAYDPDNYVGDGGEPQLLGSGELKRFKGGIDFKQADIALRITGIGYHGNVLPKGGFYFSEDRGKTWNGPVVLNGLEKVSALDSMELTPRTDYLVNTDGSVQVFISARVPEVFASDRLFCALTKDGGKNFELQSWVVPLSDPYRGVMSSSVRCSDSKIVSSVRRREAGTDHCWVDAYVSEDNGDSWKHLSKIRDTGPENGNPPALLKLSDGRLVAAYGQRERKQIIARISDNEGVDWGPEIIIRDDYWSDEHGDADLGYPRLVERKDGKVLTLYYWATETLKEQQIAVTIWDPDKLIMPE